MKKMVLLIIAFLLVGTNMIHAQEINVDVSFKFNGDYKPDSVFLFFYSSAELKLGDRHPAPIWQFALTETKNIVELEFGLYTMGVLAQGYKCLHIPVIIPNDKKKYKMEVVLNPQIIGWGGITEIEQINEVALRGDFNNYGKQNEITLVKDGNLWKLDPVPNILRDGECYIFYVNGQETIDLLNSTIVPNFAWLTLRNVFENKKIEFDPSLYSLVYKESELMVQDQEFHNQFVNVFNDTDTLFEKLEEKFPTIIQIPYEEKKLYMDSICTDLKNIEKKYDPRFRQFFIDKYLLANVTKIIYVNLFNAPTQKANSSESENKSSSDLENSIKDIINLVTELDPNSDFVSDGFALSFQILKTVEQNYPGTLERSGISENYLDDWTENFLAKSNNKRMCCNLLLNQAQQYVNTNEKKSRELLDRLINDYDYEKYVDNNRVKRLIASLNVGIGKIAPDFSVQTVDGNSLSLSDYKGKFVLIDFWGSWCGPCLRELPHIKKFYNSVSRDKLEIIGLAGNDTELALKECITKNEVKYPNALVSNSLLAKFGISSFPTSCLVNPEGKIIRKNVRGEAELLLVTEEIERYFK